MQLKNCEIQGRTDTQLKWKFLNNHLINLYETFKDKPLQQPTTTTTVISTMTNTTTTTTTNTTTTTSITTTTETDTVAKFGNAWKPFD